MNLFKLSEIGNNSSHSASPENVPFYRKPYCWLIALIILVIIVLVRCHSLNSSHKRRPPAVQVVLAPVKISNVPVYLSALGAVTPTYSVTVRTQINGQLMQVLFKEGQMVKKGDLLAEIDSRPYEAQLIQFQGQLTRDLALLANAQVDLKRYQTLYKQNSVSQQTLATQDALVKQNEGTVKLDQGQIAEVQVNLIYCRITSPVDGKIGLRLVDPGNFVQTTDTSGIAVVNTLNPITVVFSLPEDSIPLVQQQLAQGKQLIAEAYNRDQNKFLATGTLLAVDNEVDPTTGTFKLKAQFANNDFHLFPSQFVNIKLLVTTLPQATLIPTAAIQQGPQGPYVYVADQNNIVKVSPVKVSVTSGNNTVVTAGVAVGQTVVVEGVDRLTDGATITVYKAPPPTSSPKPADNKTRPATT